VIKVKKKNNNLINFFCIFVIIQPIFDVLIYLLREVAQVNSNLISLIRPFLATIIYFGLLISNNVGKRKKIWSFLYLFIFSLYCVLHLINVKNNFFELSYGDLFDEMRQLVNYGYFLLQLINVYLIFSIATKDEKEKIILSLVCASALMASLYLMSVISGTSLLTYKGSLVKHGYKGWSISAHYIGHSLLLMFPIVIYAIYNNLIKNNLIKAIVFLLPIIPCVYLVGTKSPLFGVLAILVFTSLLLLIRLILRKEKLNFINVLIVLTTFLVIFTFTSTYGYENFYNQKKMYDKDLKVDKPALEDYIREENINKITDDKYNSDRIYKNDFEIILSKAIKKYKTPDFASFDNRTIQFKINKELFKLSPIKDRLLGYGYYTMINCSWVETDTFAIFFSFGIVGFLLILFIPLMLFVIEGLLTLINYKKLNLNKLILGFSTCIAVGLITFVGYTIHFSQTVFYFIMLLVISNNVFKEEEYKNKRKYLFMINDLHIGGAEVGLIDVVNELSKTDTVDVVLLRKEGELLKRLDSKVNVYSILNDNYSKLKNKIYYILYFMGGIFTRYVYSNTINTKYDVEIAYLEGFPAVFIASSTNSESVKIASIRVGLKNHKLSASNVPFGMFNLKKAYDKMDKIYTVSNQTTSEFIEKYPSCKEKTTTIYTYFNVDYIKEKSMEKHKKIFNKNRFNFLAVGRFSEQKGYDRLIDAFEVVHNINKNTMLYIIGNNNTDVGRDIKKKIKVKKLEKYIKLEGIIQNPYPYMNECDVLISSSYYEGYPRVINEALALRKICVGPRVTGMDEALDNGRLGILTENSTEGLIDGMLKAMNKNITNKYKEELELFDGNKSHYFESLNNLVKRKEKMIIYMPKLSFGGMEKALVNLINYSKLNDKYDLTLYLVYRGEMNYISLLPSNIKLIIACPGQFNIFGKLIAAIKLIIRYIYHVFNKYDISISYSYQHPILCSLTRFASKNSIVYIHGNLAQGVTEKHLKKQLRGCKYEKFNKIICVSKDAKNTLCKLINRDEKVYAINNMIDGDQIIAKSKEEIEDFKFKKDKIYFINICRHSDLYKKLTRLITAVNKLNSEGYDFEVILIGDGEDHKMYLDLVNEKGIKNIHFLGKKSNPYKYLKKSSAFVLSSVREGYPVVFIEAMILNIPIITTDVSDAKEDIDGKFGIVVKNDDESIYKGMKKFLNSGYKIKKKFNYVEFNKKLEKETNQVYKGGRV